MPIVKTRAVPLAVHPFGNTSCTVQWVTAEQGRLTTLLKGAYRPKSLFLGQFDLFATSELLFYQTDREGLPIAKECALLEPRLGLRRNWRNALAAGYITALFTRTVPQEVYAPDLLSEFEQALDLAQASRQPERFLCWYELHFAEHHGHRPRFDVPSRIRPPGTALQFDIPNGRLLEKTQTDSNPSDSVPLTPDVVAMLRAWQQAPTPRSAETVRCTPAQNLLIHRLLGGFMSWHFGIPPAVRRAAFNPN